MVIPSHTATPLPWVAQDTIPSARYVAGRPQLCCWVVGSATSYRLDGSTDGEIEFKDYQGDPCGQRVYVQLKSGDAHLRSHKRDKREVFDIKKPRWAEYWIQQQPTLLRY